MAARYETIVGEMQARGTTELRAYAAEATADLDAFRDRTERSLLQATRRVDRLLGDQRETRHRCAGLAKTQRRLVQDLAELRQEEIEDTMEFNARYQDLKRALQAELKTAKVATPAIRRQRSVAAERSLRVDIEALVQVRVREAADMARAQDTLATSRRQRAALEWEVDATRGRVNRIRSSYLNLRASKEAVRKLRKPMAKLRRFGDFLQSADKLARKNSRCYQCSTYLTDAHILWACGHVFCAKCLGVQGNTLGITARRGGGTAGGQAMVSGRRRHRRGRDDNDNGGGGDGDNDDGGEDGGASIHAFDNARDAVARSRKNFLDEEARQKEERNMTSMKELLCTKAALRSFFNRLLNPRCAAEFVRGAAMAHDDGDADIEPDNLLDAAEFQNAVQHIQDDVSAETSHTMFDMASDSGVVDIYEFQECPPFCHGLRTAAALRIQKLFRDHCGVFSLYLANRKQLGIFRKRRGGAHVNGGSSSDASDSDDDHDCVDDGDGENASSGGQHTHASPPPTPRTKIRPEDIPCPMGHTRCVRCQCARPGPIVPAIEIQRVRDRLTVIISTMTVSILDLVDDFERASGFNVNQRAAPRRATLAIAHRLPGGSTPMDMSPVAEDAHALDERPVPVLGENRIAGDTTKTPFRPTRRRMLKQRSQSARQVLTMSKRASFFSTPEQVAKREELEAKMLALQREREEAAMAAKKEKIATEKAERGRRMSTTTTGTSTISKRTSFFSSSEQIAKRDDMEAQLKAAKLDEDEAALKTKKDHIASEKARKAAGPGGQLGKSNRGSFYSTPEQIAKREDLDAKLNTLQQAEEEAAMAAKKKKIATEKAERGRRMSKATAGPSISKRASFFSSSEQIAKREEMEAQLKAAKLAEDEALLKAKRDQIALEKELRKSRVSMASGTGDAAAQARQVMKEMRAKAEAEEAAALQARKDLISAEKARKAAAGEQPNSKPPGMGFKRKSKRKK